MQVNKISTKTFDHMDQFGHENAICHENNQSVASAHFKNPSSTNAKITTNSPLEYYNGYHFHDLYYRGWIQMNTELQINSDRTYYLNLDHCSTIVNDQPLSMIDIYVNDQLILEGYNPKNGGNFSQQHLDITQFLQDGSNTVKIMLNNNSEARYWLSSIDILTDQKK